MNRGLIASVALAVLALLPSVASAELRRVDITVLGMD
jgi:hypothetical protein